MKKEGTERQITAIKQLRAKLNMNRTEFSTEIGIPLRMPEQGLLAISGYILKHTQI